jgi:phenylalanyl-tRNA synthetase alpha chain
MKKSDLRLLELIGKGLTIDEAGRELGVKDGVHSLAHAMEKEGLLELAESLDYTVSLDLEGREYSKKGLPERRALESIEGGMDMSKLSLPKNEIPIALMWLKKKNWASIEKGRLTLTKQGKAALGKRGKDEELLGILESGGRLKSELKGFDEAIEMLKRRQGNISVREVRGFRARLTDKGKKVMRSPEALESGGVSSLTHEMLKTRSWRDVKFRRYGIREAEEIWPAKLHPLRIAIEKIKRIFLEMGFAEATGNFVESSFWNFDALFQPQDHPARDLADTFYINNIVHELPRYHREVKRAHESGGDMESRGWQYEWDPELAKQTVLRTHTTAVTARSLTQVGVPAKVFSIGRVFRNEALDYKHLAEFYQVEGIVVGEDVNFPNLLWYLKEFYTKLGFKKIRFRPAYFPYTEMSCEPEVYFEDKKEWVELGGSGIFRPEVVKPLLGVEVPVLAWGLSLERPVMFKMGIDDLRTFYKNDLDWLRGYKINEVL